MRLKKIIKKTWHVCEHDFKAVAVNEDAQDFECQKCHVSATNRYAGKKLILVNPESNAPLDFEPWGNSKALCISIRNNTK